MIREPYNVNPYNTTIDITQNPTFGFSFSGDALARAQIIIAQNNSDGTPLITSGVSDGAITDEMRQTYVPGIRNNDEVILEPNLENIEGIQNGTDYIWKLRLTEDNASFHYWCHFANDHLFEDDVVTMPQDEYVQYIVNPMLNKHEHHTLLDYETVSQRLQDYHQAVIYYHESYYRILRVEAGEEGIVQLLLHKAIPSAFSANEKFLLFTNATVGQYNYATQQVKQGRALDQEIETGIILTRGIPYDMSKACRFESGVFVALADNGTYYDSTTEQFIMGDNAKIINVSSDNIIVDVPCTVDLTKGLQVNAQLVLDGFAHTVTAIEAPPADNSDVTRVGYYRFTCKINNNSLVKAKDIVNYEIRGWNTTLDIYKNITTEVIKTAYSYDNLVYAITCDGMLEQRVIAYEQWDYSNGDIRGFIYYADFHRNWEPLQIKPNTNFILKSNFYDSNWNYFQTRKAPDASVVCLDVELDGNNKYPIDTSIAFFQGFYNSYGATTIKTHRWTIARDNQMIYDSGVIYDTDLTLRYEDFSIADDYIVTLEIVSQNGNICIGKCVVQASEEVEMSSDLEGTSEILAQQPAIKLTWPGLLVTEGKTTHGCNFITDESPAYLHIPRFEQLIFDNIGGGKINISTFEIVAEHNHHFEMRLAINDYLEYYAGNIFTLSNSQTGQTVTLYKDGTTLYWKDTNGAKTKILDLLQPEFGLQATAGAREAIDYRWLSAPTGQSELYWTETNTDTNYYIWDIAIDIKPSGSFASYRKGAALWTETPISCAQAQFDTIVFNGDIDLYYFAYALGTSKFAQLANGPAWAGASDDEDYDLIPKIIYKYSGEEFVSNPSMDYATNGLGNSGAIIEYLIYRTYEDAIREKIGSIKLTDNLIGLNSYYFIDWTCPNRVKPTYDIVPITIDDRASRRIKIKVDHTPEWDYWAFVELKHYENQHYIPGQQWKFYLNLSTGEYTHNITKTYHQGFSAAPKASVGPTNYLTTSLTGLLANLQTIQSPWWKEEGDTEYYQIQLANSLKIDQWNQFVYNTNFVLVKDIIGHCFIANLSNNRHSIEDVGELTTNVSFDITQIDNISNYQIFTSVAQED